MDEAMMREAAQALAARLNRLLNASMASEIVLSREEALLALGSPKASSNCWRTAPRAGKPENEKERRPQAPPGSGQKKSILSAMISQP